VRSRLEERERELAYPVEAWRIWSSTCSLLDI
jgi:hypothetical protein